MRKLTRVAADATQFLTKIAGKTTDASALVREAHILAVSEVAQLNLRAGKLDECKVNLAEAKKLLDNLTGVDSAVYASYYFAASEYAKRKSTAAEFYKNALLFLAYANIERIPLEERKVFAFDLVVSALVGENVFSFGELVRVIVAAMMSPALTTCAQITQPIVGVLAVADTKWLLEVLSAFNHGDITKWKALATQYSAQVRCSIARFTSSSLPYIQLGSVPALAQNAQTLVEKITILALMELVFSLPSDKRTVPFATLAQVSQVPLNEVRCLVRV